MLGIVLTALAIATYHILVVKCCLRRQDINPGAPRRVPDLEQQAGIDDKILETIPIIAYSSQKSDLFQVDQSECVVCLGELEGGNMVRLLPNCMHVFHVPCIDEWLMAHTSCPVCRSPIVAPANNSFPALSLHVCDNEGNNVRLLPQDHEHVGEAVGDVNNASHRGLLRHCASMVLPMERRQSRHLVTGLKRSLSMDQSFVVIDVQREGLELGSSSSSSSAAAAASLTKGGLVRNGLLKTRSIRHLDRVSSKLLRSFSRLRIGGESGMLPY
ncbi:hypothetical protein RJ640_024084 [Escallonia rubra]|uniref:RING-type E3 ubiquitin transferase n=1 Tax=Escallonia rubra TaxID=112253 RepID=A0AA88UIV3_9ASTE|nr:hypothetical protein RJ640_024084 [Escallonia rubra]